MSSTIYQIKEHLVPCQHIRQYAHATLGSQEDVLHLAVKQYTPLDNLDPSPGDLTIIGAHANGFPKVRNTCLLSTCVVLFSSRNCTNLYGMGYMAWPIHLDSKSEIYGLLTSHTKEYLAL